ncbi:MAG: DUF86 domain-containing protein [Nanoarchaeota archaeon]
MNRIKDKIKDLEKATEELESFLPSDFKEYKNNKTKAACERYFEKIVEGMIDLAFIFIKEKKLKKAEEDKAAFDILSNEKIISEELAEKLKSAKGMRNVIAHEYQYGKINDEQVFEAVSKEIIQDSKEFLSKIKIQIK